MTAAKTNVIAEINTGAIARGAMDDTYPSAEFLEIIYDLGIPVCINSDAHTTDGIDCAFDRAIQLAKKTGYTELVYPGNIIVDL
jgi:histidinol-phosphatase (PHP family)